MNRISLFILILTYCCDLSGQSGKWIKLFDGKTTHGWHSWKDNNVKGWYVNKGQLTTDGKNPDLVSDLEFENFELEFEFLVSFKGNSGVMYKVIENPNDIALFATYASAPEYQVIDDQNYEGINDGQKTGANYDLDPPSSLTAVRPVGKWNKGKIIVKKDRVEHYLNGKLVVAYIYGSQEWKDKVAKSKFAKWPYANPHKKGRIALQDHGDKIAFRKIRVRVLP